jgi:uncharacterized protein (DUF983 family)
MALITGIIGVNSGKKFDFKMHFIYWIGMPLTFPIVIIIGIVMKVPIKVMFRYLFNLLFKCFDEYE